MPTIGWFEILIVVGIAIVVLGPKDFQVYNIVLASLYQNPENIEKYNLKDIADEAVEVHKNDMSVKKMSDYIYAIEAKGVNKTFIKKNKKTLALQDFNIQIKKGSIHGLLGPNGAGKSTFINILGSLVKKDSGIINICNLNIDTATKQSKFKIV